MEYSYSKAQKDESEALAKSDILEKQIPAPKKYGSMTPFEISEEVEDFDLFVPSEHTDWKSPTNERRWSVIDKFDRRYYCRIRSCSDCLSILNCRCLFSTAMLGTFVILAAIFMRSVLYTSDSNLQAFGFGFDYIIIGGGPAGSVVTSRLVAKGAKVLLLEAGTNTQYDLGGTDYFGGPITRFDIPLLWSSISHFGAFHWHGFNIPNVLIAKALGGCGVHNAMLYVRALATDIHGWKLEDWTWENILRIYISLETFTVLDEGAKVPPFHGTNGPVMTARPSYVDQMAPEFVSSAVQSGIKFTVDFNDPDGGREGVGYYHFNIKDGMRDSAAREFLGPLMKSKSSLFSLELNATVRRIILAPIETPTPKPTTATSPSRLLSSMMSSALSFLSFGSDTPQDDPSLSSAKRHIVDDESTVTKYEAIGVEYEQDNSIKRAYLKRWSKTSSILPSFSKFDSSRSVIVTAGAIMTPKILMNSGIGPTKVLTDAGIDVKVDSPRVGKNLQDHPSVGLSIKISPAIAASYENAYTLASQWGTYVDTVEKSKRGEVVSPLNYGVLGSAGLAAGAFLKSPYAVNGIPDIQLTVFPTVAGEPHITHTNQLNKNATSLDILMQNNHMLISVTLLNPDGRYEITLNNTDPIGSVPMITVPEGHERFLSDRDINALVWGVEKVKSILKFPPLEQLTQGTSSPPAEYSENQLRDWVESNVYPNSHWIGTASMGKDISSSVTDSHLRVHNVKGLRVADASVIPTIPNGNVHSTVLVVASMAADFIINELSLDSKPN